MNKDWRQLHYHSIAQRTRSDSLDRRALIIGPDHVLARQIQHILQRRGMDVLIATSNAHGLACAFQQQPDVIILSSKMMEPMNMSVYEELKRDPRTASIPIIVLNDPKDDTAGVNTGLKNGDYQFALNAFIAYTLVDLLRTMQLR